MFNKKPKKQTPEPEEEINSSGWDAITDEFDRVHERLDNHYASLIKWRLGGEDPLNGISVYDGGDYWHFVSYGLSELYDKESDDEEYSGYGMEFTLKLKKGCCDTENEEKEKLCICGILQAIAKITFEKGELFLPNEYVYTGQTEGMDVLRKSKLTGFITVSDPSVNTISTPNGRVEFVEFIGATDSELKAIIDKQTTVKELYEKMGTDITDYSRESLF